MVDLFQTKRLTLRQINNDDMSLGLEIFTSPQMMEFLGEPWSHEETKESMEEWQREWGKNNYYYGIVELKEENNPIGLCGISENTNPHEKGIELCWFILPEHQKQGYASELTEGLIDFVFHKLQKERLFAETSPSNKGANKLLQSKGFRDLGVVERQYDYLPDLEKVQVWELIK